MIFSFIRHTPCFDYNYAVMPIEVNQNRVTNQSKVRTEPGINETGITESSN